MGTCCSVLNPETVLDPDEEHEQQWSLEQSRAYFTGSCCASVSLIPIRTESRFWLRADNMKRELLRVLDVVLGLAEPKLLSTIGVFVRDLSTPAALAGEMKGDAKQLALVPLQLQELDNPAVQEETETLLGTRSA